MKMPTAELYLKEATAQSFTAFTCLQQDCPNQRESCKGQIARTCSTPSTGVSFQLSDEYGIVEVQVVEMTEAAATKLASITTLHVSVV